MLLLDQSERLLRLAPVVAARGLVVRDLNGEFRLAGDTDGLFDRLQKALALVTHVRHVEAAVFRRDLRERDDLLGAGEGAGRVDETGGEAERAGGHAFGHVLSHLFEFGCIRLAAVHAQGAVADGAVGDETADVEGEARLFDRGPRIR